MGKLLGLGRLACQLPAFEGEAGSDFQRWPSSMAGQQSQILETNVVLRTPWPSCSCIHLQAWIRGLEEVTRLVHGGGWSAHATNRPTAAVGKSVEEGSPMTASSLYRDSQSTWSGPSLRRTQCREAVVDVAGRTEGKTMLQCSPRQAEL